MDDEYEVYEESWTGRIAIAAIVAVALIAGAFFAGRALADGGGPATLAEAVEQARAGDLPCGETAAGGAGAPGGGFPLGALCGDRDGQQQAPNARGRFGGFGQTGQVTAVSADSLTVTGPMGETTVKLGEETTVNKPAAGKLADIESGDTVLVARDGETATSVTVLPQDGS